MKIDIIKSSLILLLVLLANARAGDISYSVMSINMNQQHYQLQIADNNQRRTQGLMFRPTLGADKGMLFVYPQSGNYRIWMKNTLIPLTVIWMNEEAEIVDIKLLLPCKQPSCPIYSAPEPARYIIELNQSQYHLYKKGDRFPELKGVLSSLPAVL